MAMFKNRVLRLLLLSWALTFVSSNVTMLQYKVDSSAEGCTGLFWRTRVHGRYVTGTSQSDPPWPRNGAIVEGHISTFDGNFLVVHDDDGARGEFALPFHDEQGKYTYLHPVAQGSLARTGFLPSGPSSVVDHATVFDVLVLGSGPAGLTAAIYAARNARSVLVIGGPSPGGAMMVSKSVENFPTSPVGSGADILARLVKQAADFGTKFEHGVVSGVHARTPGCTGSGIDNECFTAQAADGSRTFTLHSRSIIVASGATEKWLGLPGEEALYGRSLHTCAYCDARFYEGHEVCVIGGGDAALEAAASLARVARKVTVIHRREAWRGTATTATRVESMPSVRIIRPFVVKEWIVMDGKLLGAKVKHASYGTSEEVHCTGAFVMIGREPQISFLPPTVSRDSRGFVLKSRYSMTSVQGIFTAGQVADARYQQAVTAAAGGAEAAMDAGRWLDGEFDVGDTGAMLRGAGQPLDGQAAFSLLPTSWTLLGVVCPALMVVIMMFSPTCRRQLLTSSLAEWAKTS